MQKRFFFICPTDCLEHTINTTFKYENYFYTSLGNSFNYNRKTIVSYYLNKKIKELELQLTDVLKEPIKSNLQIL